MIKPIKPSIGL